MRKSKIKISKAFTKKLHGSYSIFFRWANSWITSTRYRKIIKSLEKSLEAWDTILMIEHDKNIVQFADDIIELDDGRVVESPLSF